MIEKLGKREKRVLMIGVACAAAILMIALGTKWFEHWGKTRKELAATRAKLKRISVDEPKQAGLFSIVPVFEMPKPEQDQELLFRDKLNEQLKKVGIRSEPLQALPSTQGQGGYKLLRLKCSAKCQFMQVLDLLAELKQNPYLVGIEEMRIKVATTTRQQQAQRPDRQGPDVQRPEGQGPGGQGPEGQRPGGQRPEGQRQQRQEVELNLTVSTFAK